MNHHHHLELWWAISIVILRVIISIILNWVRSLRLNKYLRLFLHIVGNLSKMQINLTKDKLTLLCSRLKVKCLYRYIILVLYRQIILLIQSYLHIHLYWRDNHHNYINNSQYIISHKNPHNHSNRVYMILSRVSW